MKTVGQVCCIGELLIDFICKDISRNLIEGKTFEKHAGGAPANVSATVAKLGGKASFIGKVGDDPFGRFLKQTLDNEHVDTSMLMLDKQFPTTLAFVSLEENGERDFVFHRGADQQVTFSEIDVENIKKASILHLGSATAMLANPFKETYFRLIDVAKKNHKFISFDPNYRVDLWKGRIEEFIEASKEAIAQADFVKVSEEELEILTGIKEKQQAITLLHKLGASIVAVTLGEDGTLISNGIHVEKVASINVESIDSTGAGDAFVGAMLWKISQMEQPKRMKEEFQLLKDFVSFANKVGALVCTKLGAISSIPNLDEIKGTQ